MFSTLCTVKIKKINEILREINFGEFLLQLDKSYVKRQIKTWSRQYEASKTEEIDAMNKVMDWLPKNIPPQIKDSVVHGDFRVDNLIYDKKNPEKVLAVLDWELSTIGDPIADATYACMAHHIPNDAKMLAGLKGLNLQSTMLQKLSKCEVKA